MQPWEASPSTGGGGAVCAAARGLHAEKSPPYELGDAIAGPSAPEYHKADMHQVCHGRRGRTPRKAKAAGG
jgi:hypothetical protein